MIIELPSSSSNVALEQEVKSYKMGFFHFSNNNLSIRKKCAEDIGKYDLDAEKSEDVDVSFRVAQSRDWIAFREKGCTLKHKARKSVAAFVRQMWGWGYHVGYPYSKTRIKGFYFYWVSSRKRDITFKLEFGHLPFLICLFLTHFHLFHLFLAAAVTMGVAGHPISATLTGAVAAFCLWRYLNEIRGIDLPFWQRVQIGLIHYCANMVFISASFFGAIKYRVFLIPASIFRPTGPDKK